MRILLLVFRYIQGFFFLAFVSVIAKQELDQPLYPRYDPQTRKYGYVATLEMWPGQRFVIPPQFDDAWTFSEGLGGVRVGKRYGFINPKGAFAIPLRFDYVYPFVNGFAVVKLSGKWGLINHSGKQVVPIRYNGLGYFSEGVMPAKIGELWGFMDLNQKFMIPPRFDNASHFSEGVAPVATGKRWGFIDHKGQYVIPPQFEYALPFYGEAAVAKQNGKYGYIDIRGNWVVPPIFRYAYSLSAKGADGTALVYLDSHTLQLVKTGKTWQIWLGASLVDLSTIPIDELPKIVARHETSPDSSSSAGFVVRVPQISRAQLDSEAFQHYRKGEIYFIMAQGAATPADQKRLYRKALEYFQKVIYLDPRFQPVYTPLGSLLSVLDPLEHKRFVEECTSSDNLSMADKSFFLARLRDAFAKENKLRVAERTYLEAIRSAPPSTNRAEWHFELAHLYERMGLPDQAQKYWKRGIQEHLELAKIADWFSAAQHLERVAYVYASILKDCDQAMATIRRIRKELPGYPGNLGYIERECVPLLSEAALLADATRPYDVTRNYNALMALIRLYMSRGDIANATQAYQRLVAIEPNPPISHPLIFEKEMVRRGEGMKVLDLYRYRWTDFSGIVETKAKEERQESLLDDLGQILEELKQRMPSASPRILPPKTMWAVEWKPPDLEIVEISTGTEYDTSRLSLLEMKAPSESFLRVGEWRETSRRVLVRAHLSNFLSGTKLISAKLLFYAFPGLPSGSFDLRKIKFDWRPEEVSWVHRMKGRPWRVPGGDVWGSSARGFDVTNDIRYFLQHPNKNFGWLLRTSVDPIYASGFITFFHKTDPYFYPRLIVIVQSDTAPHAPYVRRYERSWNDLYLDGLDSLRQQDVPSALASWILAADRAPKPSIRRHIQSHIQLFRRP